MALLPIPLPYRRSVNWYLLSYAGLVLFGFLLREVPAARRGPADVVLTLHLGLFLFALTGFTRLMRFRPEGKEPPEQAWLRIPVLEFYVWCIAGMAGVFVWVGLLNYMDGLPGGIATSVKAGLVVVLLLLALNSRKILFRDDLIPYEVAKELAARKTDPGLFQYTDDGFRYDGRHPFECRWTDIEILMACKTDNFAYDTVHLILKTEHGKEWSVHEDTAGWFVFIDRLEQQLPGINPIWQLEVIAQPFATSATLVYERGRDLRAAWAEQHGPDKPLPE